jgi:hypothetical protein
VKADHEHHEQPEQRDSADARQPHHKRGSAKA